MTHADEHFTLCADFNFNPYLISHVNDRYIDQIPVNNSILFMPEERTAATIKNVTVDGILLSKLAKQSSYGMNANVFFRLRLERKLVLINDDTNDRVKKIDLQCII